MRKLLKRIVIIILGTAMFLFVGLMLLGLYFGKNENAAGEKSADKKESEMSISYDFTGKRPDFSLNEDEIPEEKYYESVEEALKNKIFSEGMEYLINIDEVIKKLESEEYVALFYRTIKDKKTECFTACKLKVKEFDGVKKYAFLFAYPTETKKNAWFMGDSTDVVRSYLDFIDYMKSMDVSGKNQRFVWGKHPFSNIDTLKIEGQEPTEIIPYEMFGKTRYFWYYEDLESDKPGQQLEYDMEVLEDYKY